jgi:hypothetical protein
VKLRIVPAKKFLYLPNEESLLFAAMWLLTERRQHQGRAFVLGQLP